jgi:hypothetical protein
MIYHAGGDSMDQLQRIILWYGLDDWVPLRSVVGAAQAPAAAPTDADKTRALEAIGDLASAGLVEIGGVTEAEGFVPWSIDLDESLKRIQASLNSADENQWGFVSWLRNTPEGDKLAEQWRDDPPVPGAGSRSQRSG